MVMDEVEAILKRCKVGRKRKLGSLLKLKVRKKERERVRERRAWIKKGRSFGELGICLRRTFGGDLNPSEC